MKKINLFLILILCFVFVSCEKDEITVNLNQSGTVEVKTVGLNNEPLVDATVKIGDDNYPLLEGKTDDKGIYKSEKLLQGHYTCYVQAVEGKVTYFDSKKVQIVTNENKKIELNPFANVGDIVVTLLDYYYSRPLNGTFNVALVPYNIYPVSIEDIKSAAHFVLTTTSDGKVTFPKVPARITYQVFVFDSNRLYSTYYNLVYAVKGETRTSEIEVRP